MSKKILVFLLASIVLILMGCGESDPKETTTEEKLPPSLQAIKDSGKLVVGTAITRPFEYRDPQTNDLIGFDIDLMTKIAERLGVTVEWREFAFADLLNELNAGSVQVVIAGMYINPTREELVDMSQPYLDTGLILVVQSTNTDIQTYEDLGGKTVGVKEGSTGEKWAIRLRDEQGIPLEIRRYTDTLDSLDDLNAGLLDAVFNDRINSLEYIKTHPDVRLQGEVFDPAGVGISVRTGETDLLNFINESLVALEADGTSQELYLKWIEPESNP